VSALARGVLVAVIQVGLIGAVGAKLLYDRATLPRAWVETAGVDPDLPIRGRYVALNLLFPAAPESASVRGGDEVVAGRIEVRNGQPVAVLSGAAEVLARGGVMYFRERSTAGAVRWMLVEPVAFFLPEHAPDPTRNVRSGDLWLEASFPARSAPRPIRLESRRN
jgi:hypothetical protein